MAHYNNTFKRQAIVDQLRKEGGNPFPKGGKHQETFIALCVYPYSWEVTYAHIRDPENARNNYITIEDWSVLQGVIIGILVLDKKKLRHSHLAIEEVTIDFVNFIRNDSVGDPWKFILNAKRYIHRYLILHSLAQFGIDWRNVAKVAGATRIPNPKTMHSLCTNIYARNAVLATFAFRNYYSPWDEGYQLGVNDLQTIIEQTVARNKKAFPIDRFTKVFHYMNNGLPNWSKDVRGKVGYYLSYLLPAHLLMEKQMLESTQRLLKYEDKN